MASNAVKSPHGPVRRAGIWLHRWLGLTVGVVFVLVALSGSLLAYGEALKGWLYPKIDGPAPPGFEAERAQVLSEVSAAYASGDISVLRFPTVHVRAYEIWLAGGELHYLDPLTGELLLTRHAFSDVLAFAVELHVHLLAGETGERVLGWLGLAMLVLLLTGLWLWWPRAGLWKMSFMRPRFGLAMAQWHYWHRTIGVFVVALLFFVTLTGAALIFYYPARTILTTLLGGEAPVLSRTVDASADDIDWPAVLQTLDSTFPGAQSVFYAPPSAPEAALSFRKKQSSELHPNGRSVVLITRDGELVDSLNAVAQDTGVRATYALYPLHAGKTGAAWWRLLVAISGLLPLVLFITGVVLWMKRRQQIQ